MSDQRNIFIISNLSVNIFQLNRLAFEYFFNSIQNRWLTYHILDVIPVHPRKTMLP